MGTIPRLPPIGNPLHLWVASPSAFSICFRSQVPLQWQEEPGHQLDSIGWKNLMVLPRNRPAMVAAETEQMAEGPGQQMAKGV